MANLKAIYAQTQQRQQPIEHPPPPYTDEPPAAAANEPVPEPQPLASPTVVAPTPASREDDNLPPDPQRPSAPKAREIPFGTSTPSPPSTAQRARAPLTVRQSNSSITEDFVVQRPTTKATKPPDVFLKTSNAKINSVLWAEPSIWQRAFSVVAETSNGSINLGIMTTSPGQGVDVKAQTSNAQCNMYLPNDFHGRIKLCTSNSSVNLSPYLQARSVRIPNGDKDEKAVWFEIGGPDGPSKAELWSTNARVRASTLEERETEKEASSSSSCSVM